MLLAVQKLLKVHIFWSCNSSKWINAVCRSMLYHRLSERVNLLSLLLSLLSLRASVVFHVSFFQGVWVSKELIFKGKYQRSWYCVPLGVLFCFVLFCCCLFSVFVFLWKLNLTRDCLGTQWPNNGSAVAWCLWTCTVECYCPPITETAKISSSYHILCLFCVVLDDQSTPWYLLVTISDLVCITQVKE